MWILRRLGKETQGNTKTKQKKRKKERVENILQSMTFGGILISEY